MTPERVKLGPGPSHLVARIPTGSGHSVVAAGLVELPTASVPQGSLVLGCSLVCFLSPESQVAEICPSLLGLKVQHQAWLTSCFPGVWPLPQELPLGGDPNPCPVMVGKTQQDCRGPLLSSSSYFSSIPLISVPSLHYLAWRKLFWLQWKVKPGKGNDPRL